MKIDYNKFTEDELKVILNAARTINYAFGLQFPSYKEQLALLLEDMHFRAINQIVQQTHCKQSPTSVARIPTHNRRDFSASHGGSPNRVAAVCGGCHDTRSSINAPHRRVLIFGPPTRRR